MLKVLILPLQSFCLPLAVKANLPKALVCSFSHCVNLSLFRIQQGINTISSRLQFLLPFGFIKFLAFIDVLLKFSEFFACFSSILAALFPIRITAEVLIDLLLCLQIPLSVLPVLLSVFRTIILYLLNFLTGTLVGILCFLISQTECLNLCRGLLCMLFLCLEQFVCLLDRFLQFLLVVPERREVSCTLTIRGITSQQFSYFHLCLLADGTSLTHFLLYLLQCLRRFRLSNLVPQHSTQFTHRRGIGFAIVLVRLAKCSLLASCQCSITCSFRHSLICSFNIR